MKLGKFLGKNNSEKIKINYSSNNFELIKAHKTDSGFDIQVDVLNDVLIPPAEHPTISTGIQLEIPEGHDAQIRPS